MDHASFAKALQQLTALPAEQVQRALKVSETLHADDREEFLAALTKVDQELAQSGKAQEQSVIGLENANISVEKMLKRQERDMAEQSENGGELGQVEQKISNLP